MLLCLPSAYAPLWGFISAGQARALQRRFGASDSTETVRGVCMYFERNAVEEWYAGVTEQAAMMERGECVLPPGAGIRGERTCASLGKLFFFFFFFFFF